MSKAASEKISKLKPTIEAEIIQSKIHVIRGVRVMLDRDLAELYQVKPFRLREQVKRNKERFPLRYMFQLVQNEVDFLVSQNAIPSKKYLGGSLPYVFTEHGTLMLASVLNSTISIQVNQKIIDVFVELRNQIAANKDIPLLREKILKLEASVDEIKTGLKLEGKLVSDKITHLSRKVLNMTQILDEFQDSHLIIKRPDHELNG